MSSTQGGAATAREAPPPSPMDTRQGAHPRVDEQAGPTDVEIARRAYELYLARGAADGLDMDDWLQAERELRAPEAHASRPRD